MPICTPGTGAAHVESGDYAPTGEPDGTERRRPRRPASSGAEEPAPERGGAAAGALAPRMLPKTRLLFAAFKILFVLT